MTRVVAFIACVIPFCRVADAQPLLVPLEQERLVIAEDMIDPGNSRIVIAPSFGPWSQRARVNMTNGALPGSLRIFSCQQSMIEPDAVDAGGVVSVSRVSGAKAPTVVNAHAHNRCRVRFRVDAPVDYTLTGMITVDLDGVSFPDSWAADISVRLWPFGDPPMYSEAILIENARSSAMRIVDDAGALEPGVYELEVDASAHQVFDLHLGHSEARVDYFLRLQLTPRGAPSACPADIDGDGAVTASDLALLLSFWGPCP